MFVSAALGSSSCRAVIAAIERGVVVPVVSSQLLTDLREVLRRPKFRSVISPRVARDMVRLVKGHAVVRTVRHQRAISRDPDDDHLLSLAIEGDVAVVVSNDKDVLSLRTVGDIPTLSVRDFLAWLRRHQPK